MLKHLVVLAMVACGISATESHTAEDEFLIKQKKVFELMWHPDQPSIVLPELYHEGSSYNIEANIESYTNKLAVQKFLQLYKHGMLPRGATFSPFYPEIREEAIALFNLFYYAKDFETFYKTALWARVHVNEMQFAYSYSIAVVHRQDTKFIKLPEVFEMMPWTFFNMEVIHQAQLGRFQDFNGTKTTVNGVDAVIFPGRHSSWYIHHEDDHDSKLNYLTEDVTWNAYYFMLNLEFPFWMPSKEFGLPQGYRGEQYFYAHQQLLNRYKLERYSNGMSEIEYIDWNKPIITGYYPNYAHRNGLPVPQRESWSHVPVDKYEYLAEIQMLEARITAAIDSGYIIGKDGKLINIYTPEGFDILGNLIEGNADSYNKQFYGSYYQVASHILGFGPEPTSKHQVVPGALEQFKSSLKDPAFYRMYNKIVNFFMRYKSNLPAYSYEELVYPGVRIESVTVDKLVTFFTHYDVTLSNVVKVNSQEETSYLPKARQYHLDHIPFSIHLTVKSDKPTKAAVRIFLAPKYDEHHNELSVFENWMNFYELDIWTVDLVAGLNKLVRTSTDFRFTKPESLSAEVFHKKIQNAINHQEPFTYDKTVYGFPQRLLLPKGRKEGMPYQLFFYISELTEAHSVHYESPLWGEAIVDNKPMGFPLDRPVYGFNFTVPNMYFKDVFIYHKDVNEINVTH